MEGTLGSCDGWGGGTGILPVLILDGRDARFPSLRMEGTLGGCDGQGGGMGILPVLVLDGRDARSPNLQPVLLDVFQCMPIVAGISDKSIKILALPKSARSAERLVDPFRREAFPAVENGPKVCVVCKFKENVDMVRHDDIGVETIPPSVEEFQCILHDFAAARVPEDAFTMSCIEPLLHSFREQTLKFVSCCFIPWLRMSVRPFVAFDLPAARHLLRKRIR